jgi:hypothetical protein
LVAATFHLGAILWQCGVYIAFFHCHFTQMVTHLINWGRDRDGTDVQEGGLIYDIHFRRKEANTLIDVNKASVTYELVHLKEITIQAMVPQALRWNPHSHKASRRLWLVMRSHRYMQIDMANHRACYHITRSTDDQGAEGGWSRHASHGALLHMQSWCHRCRLKCFKDLPAQRAQE